LAGDVQQANRAPGLIAQAKKVIRLGGGNGKTGRQGSNFDESDLVGRGNGRDGRHWRGCLLGIYPVCPIDDLTSPGHRSSRPSLLARGSLDQTDHNNAKEHVNRHKRPGGNDAEPETKAQDKRKQRPEPGRRPNPTAWNTRYRAQSNECEYGDNYPNQTVKIGEAAIRHEPRERAEKQD
jgi:hypothetical protein